MSDINLLDDEFNRSLKHAAKEIVEAFAKYSLIEERAVDYSLCTNRTLIDLINEKYNQDGQNDLIEEVVLRLHKYGRRRVDGHSKIEMIIMDMLTESDSYVSVNDIRERLRSSGYAGSIGSVHAAKHRLANKMAGSDRIIAHVTGMGYKLIELGSTGGSEE